MAIYFKGTLENNSLFLVNKTNIIKKIFICCIPSYPPILPPTHHILWHFFEIIIQFWSYCYKKNHGFSFNVCMQKYFQAYLPIPKYRVGILQILNLNNDPLLENVSYFHTLTSQPVHFSLTFQFVLQKNEVVIPLYSRVLFSVNKET